MPGHKILPNSTLLTVMKHSPTCKTMRCTLSLKFPSLLPLAAPWHTSVRSGIRRRRPSVYIWTWFVSRVRFSLRSAYGSGDGDEATESTFGRTMVLSRRKTRLSSVVARVNGGGDGGRGRVGGVHVHVRIIISKRRANQSSPRTWSLVLTSLRQRRHEVVGWVDLALGLDPLLTSFRYLGQYRK